MGAENLSEVLGRWREDAERGRYVDPQSLIESHPDLAEDLAVHLQAHVLVDQYFADQDSLPFLAPEQLGDYRLVRELGRGGMGVVYEAEQVSMGRPVALKVLFPTIATTVRTRKRFEREARVTGTLHHTNVVTVHGMGNQDGYLYFAMELVRGKPLDDLIEHLRCVRDGEAGSESLDGVGFQLQGPTRYTRIAELAAGVADALEVAHAQGVIHRDVKPPNLILDEDGVLKLTDFGLAQLAGDSFGVTRTGEILGTPLYMSPEQVRAKREEVDHRTDVYSLGATLYELLALERPHAGPDVGALCTQILSEEPTPLRALDPEIPLDLATIVHKALRKEPGDRYASAGAMARDLRAFAEGRSIAARPLGRLQKAWRKVKRHKVRSALTATALLLAAAGGWLALEAREAREQRLDAQYESALRRARLATDRLTRRVSSSDGLGALGTGRPHEAEGLFAEAIALRPDRHEAWFGRALLPSLALEDQLAGLDAARSRGLGGRTYHLARAFLLRRAQRVEEAGAEETRAAAFGSASPRDDAFEGWSLVTRGQRAEGIAKLTRAIERSARGDPVRQLAYLHRGNAYEKEGRWAEALSDYLVLMDVSGSDPAIPMRVATLWRRLGQEAQAARQFEATLATHRASWTESDWLSAWSTLHGRGADDWKVRLGVEAHAAHPDSPLIRSWRATQLAQDGDEPAARALMARAVADAPADVQDRADVLASQGQMLFRFRAWAEAEGVFRRVLEISPSHTNARGNLAACLANMDRIREAEALLRQMLARDPHEPTTLTNLGQLLSRKGALEEALALAERALTLDPRKAMAWQVLSNIRADRGDHEGALEAMERALAIEPGNPSRLAHQATHLNNLGRFQEALESVERALEDDPHDAHRLYVKAYALERLEGLEAALTCVEAACVEGPQSAGGHAVRARLLRRLGRSDEATEALATSMAAKVVEPWALYERGDELLLASRFAEALEDFRSAERRQPANPGALLGQARAHVQRMEHEEALTALDRAEALGMEPALTRRYRGLALLRLQRFAEALPLLEAEAAAKPGFSEAHYNLAGTLWEVGRREEALTAMERARELAPRDAQTATALILWYAETERWADALAVAEALPADVARPPRFHRALSFCYSALGRGREALEAIERMGPAAWDDARVQHNVAWHSNDAGRHADAVRAATRAIELGAEALADIHGIRASAYHALGRYGDAAADFRAAIEHGQRHARAYAKLTSCLSMAGRPREAQDVLEKAQGLHPGAADLVPPRVEVLQQLGQTEEATVVARKALADPAFADADTTGTWRSNLLFDLAEMGQGEEALQHLDAWRGARPAQWHLTRAYVYGAMRRWAEAAEAYATYARQAPMSLPFAYNFGRALFGAERYAEAFQVLGAVLQRGYDTPAARGFRGMAAYRLGRYADAAEDLGRAVAGGERATDVCFALGDALNRTQRLEDALALVRKARAWHPEDANFLQAEAVTLVNLGREDEAVPLWKQVVDASPEHRILRSQYAVLLQDVGEAARALAEFDHLAEAGPLELRHAARRALAQAQLGRAAKARRSVQGLLARFEPDAGVLGEAAIVRMVLGDVGGAHALWQQAGGVGPGTAGAWQHLARRLVGETAAAAEGARASLALEAAARSRRAMPYLLAVAGRADGARDVLAETVHYLGAEDLMFRAAAWAILGDAAQAKAWSAKVVARCSEKGLVLPPVDPALRAYADDPSVAAWIEAWDALRAKAKR